MKSYLLRSALLIGLIVSIALPANAQPAQNHYYQPLLKLGRGEITSIDWQRSSEKILVNTTTGVWLYDDQLRDVAHPENLTMANFSPNGKLIVGRRNNKIILLDADSLQPVETFPDSADTLLDIKWSPDSNKIAGLWKNGQVVIWDATTYRRLFVFWQSTETNTFAWSPDSTKIVAFDPGGNTASIWQIATPQKRIVLQLKTKSKESASGGDLIWSPDSSQILRTARLTDKALLQSWNVQNGELLHEEEGNSISSVMRVAYRPDGQSLIIAFWGGMQLVHPRSFQKSREFDQSYSIDIARWSPDGRTIAGSGDEWTTTRNLFINLWDASTGKVVKHIPTHGEATSLFWSADGQRLLTVNRDSVIRLWDVNNGVVITERRDHGLITPTIAWNTDGSKIAVADTLDTVRIWDVKTKRLALTLKNTSDIIQVAWQPNGNLLAVASQTADAGGIGIAHDVSIRLWNTDNGQNILTDPLPDRSLIAHLLWSSDGKHLVITTVNSKVILWDTISQEFTTLADFSTLALFAASFSPDNTKLFIIVGVCCSTELFAVWNTQTKEQIKLKHDGGLGLSYPSYTWDRSSKKVLRADWPTLSSYIGGDGGGPRDPRTDPNRFKAQIHSVYPVDESALMSSPLILQGHTDFISSLTWSPDSRMIATTSADKTLHTWDADTGKPLLVIGNAELMAWSPDSRLMAAWAIGGPTRIVEATTGKTLDTIDMINGDIQRNPAYTYTIQWAPYALDMPYGATQWSPDSAKIAHVADGILTVWGRDS
ncbi:MAG: WD40 repeat domain-containing protein [Chloroflexota bacterium]